MGKFSLLTTLSLNAAGFDTGINKATKTTQSFKKGTNEASKSIATSFESMSGILGGAVTNQLGMLGQSVMGGVSAFKSMIPAINGVKMALISSGIGAIVVAIGLAFAALTSYFTGTIEGSQKLNVIMGYLKGTFNAIIKRVHLMGSALTKLFTGDFKGMKKDFEEAFKGGIFDEIKDDAKKYVGFANERNKLDMDKLKYQKEINDLKTRETELEIKMTNQNLSKAKQEEALLEKRRIGDKLDSLELELLQREYDLQVKINQAAGSNKKIDDLQKESDLYTSLANKKQEILKGEKIENKAEFRLNNDKVKTIEKEKELNEQINELFIERNSILNDLMKQKDTSISQDQRLKQLLKDSTQGVKNVGGNVDEEYIDDITVDTEKIYTKFMRLNDTLKDIKSIIQASLMDLGTTIGEGLGNLFSGDIDTKGFGYKILGVFGSFIKTLGTAILSFGVAMEAFQIALKNIFTSPFLAIGAGIALIAAGTLVQNYANKGIQGYENGGIIGGSSFSGDKITARVNSGEMILNSAQQRRLFDIANGGGNGVPQTIELVARGNDLVGVFNMTNRRQSKIR